MALVPSGTEHGRRATPGDGITMDPVEYAESDRAASRRLAASAAAIGPRVSRAPH